MRSKFSNFYFTSGLFAVISCVAAVLNYLLYPSISHLLDTASFGSFTVLNAITNQFFGILLAFNLTSIYIVKTFPEKEAKENAQTVQKSLIWMFCVLCIVLLFCSPILNQKLKIEEPFAFLVIAFTLLVSVPAVVWTGYLQGHKKILHVGVFGVVSALSKLIAALVAASLFGVVGGLVGVLAGSLVGLAILKLTSPVELPRISSIFSRFSKPQRAFLKSSRSYLMGSVVIVGVLGVLQNIDITYAKYLFSPEVAGAYSGISILSYAVFFGFFVLFWIVLPEIDLNKPLHNKQLLKTTYKIVATLGTTAILLTLAAQHLIVRLLLNDDFSHLSNMLVFAVTYQIFLVSVTLYTYYLLVIRSKFSLLLAACVAIPSLSLPLTADSPMQLIVLLNVGILTGFSIFQTIKLVLAIRSKYVKTTH